MKFYHGGASRNKIAKIRDISPSFNHGIGQNPDRVRDRPEINYFIDNGAFTSSFSEKEWIKTLEKLKQFESNPDFIVLPDVFNTPEATWERHKKYVDIVKHFGFDSYYYVAQKGSTPENIIRKALELDATGIFLGGSWHKPRVLPGFLEAAHRENLKLHIGMPGDFLWAARSGADSMDTVSIARNQAWDRLRKLENSLRHQKTLEND